MKIGAVGTLGSGDEPRSLITRWGRAIYEDLPTLDGVQSLLPAPFRRRVARPRESADAVCTNRLVPSPGPARRLRDQPGIHAWYAGKAAEHRWSVRYLEGQIDLQLHPRQGAALTNFERVLEPAEADPALRATKDPYVFDFL